MLRSCLRSLLFASTLAAAHGPSQLVFAWTSAPTLNPANGHYYAFFDASSVGPWYVRPKMSFANALERASQRSHLGTPGHLVTITSQSEQDFIFETYKSLVGYPPRRNPDKPLNNFERFWIGASDAAVEGEWRWATGPEAGQLFWRGKFEGSALGYHNWHKSSRNPLTFLEPNDWRGNVGEDFGSMVLTIVRGYDSSWWNDVSTVDDGSSYVPRMAVVEYSPIPEPSTLSLIACALLMRFPAARSRKCSGSLG